MKKTVYIVVTVLIMLIISRFVVRIIDATVQIGDDLGLLIVVLILLNAVISGLSYLLYKKTSEK
ncbi:MAG: hypothetical protein IKE36_01060 [Solobacterium sp.]|nr:hypothetical protein [Solobacterium sp.]